ncbi:hypothetical protein H257_07561 [Aphanomyces astaci]|uniref:Uncharacterized protein n=1 Tax=Aphanomyces astaci TaxID=112090 RepID=W4GGB5_APHAT|nr:hypothetical protein H257_07561 [Aphanomyces astaci]ETV78715.1 hypothetical protein H257_07561 [Aphanomyces astaci]|eukprot:XP_009831434.1 hypothetical protein H257_07561 [Aphanomyces astaci]
MANEKKRKKVEAQRRYRMNRQDRAAMDAFCIMRFPTLSDETLARRRYFREKQREYRRKLSADGAAMEAELVHLQLILDSLQAKSLPSVREASDGPLSWHSIAMVFKSEAHRVLTDRESLITQTKGFRALIASMQRFVMMNIPLPVSRSNTWPSATLVADPRTRNLGKEWLTQQMYHNIHEPFALLPAVRLDDEFFEFDFQSPDEHDDPFTFLERLQCILPGTLSSFRRFFETKVRDVLFEDPHEVTEEVVANTRLFCTTTADGDFINTLQGQFVEADRLVLVFRQVEDDEVHSCHFTLRQRSYRSWMEVRQVSPTHILMRLVSHSSRLFRAYEGFISCDEVAALWGINVTGIVDDVQKEAYVRRELIRLGNAHFLVWRRRFTALMQAS